MAEQVGHQRAYVSVARLREYALGEICEAGADSTVMACGAGEGVAAVVDDNGVVTKFE